MKPEILKLSETSFIRADLISRIYTDNGDLFVRVDGNLESYDVNGKPAKIILDWFAGQIAERLEDADDGELTNIQTDAHEAGILPTEVIAKCLARRTSRQLPF